MKTIDDETTTPGDTHPSPVDEPDGPTDRPPRGHRLGTLALAAAGYLCVSVFIWWNVWSGHPTATTVGEQGDSPLFTWFLEWPAHAIAHGLDPLYTTTLFHPYGMNLVANTGELAIGVPLAPVTWAFGPVATLNVALTLSPVLSTLAMFVLLRRWVTWAPAAFVGGLFYGFSPFVLFNLSNAHLNLGMAALPPLMIACLDELLVRQRRRPVTTGIGLGLLVTLQFFAGTELLVLTVIVAVATAVLAGLFLWWRHPDRDALRRRGRHAVVGLASAGSTAVLLLAYPTWFALEGPGHFTGLLWPGWNLQNGGVVPVHLVLPESASAVDAGLGINALLYPHFLVSFQYFGLGVVAVVAVGLVLWRHDRRQWLFATVAAVSLVLALGADGGVPKPWAFLYHLPLLGNVVPVRFVIITYLAVAVLLGLVVDHTYGAVGGRRPGPASRPDWSGAVAATIVSAVALVPVAAYLGPYVPMSATPVVVPTWFRTVAPHLTGHQVILGLPAPFTTREAGMTWQALDHMQYSIVGGGGPGTSPSRAGPERAGQIVLGATSFSFLGEAFQAGDVRAVRQALDGWGVTTVVVPDEPGLPAYDQIPSVTFAAALLTAATGRLPTHQAGAWVWSGLSPGGGSASSPAGSAQLTACTSGLARQGAAAVERASRCALEGTGSARS